MDAFENQELPEEIGWRLQQMETVKSICLEALAQIEDAKGLLHEVIRLGGSVTRLIGLGSATDDIEQRMKRNILEFLEEDYPRCLSEIMSGKKTFAEIVDGTPWIRHITEHAASHFGWQHYTLDTGEIRSGEDLLRRNGKLIEWYQSTSNFQAAAQVATEFIGKELEQAVSKERKEVLRYEAGCKIVDMIAPQKHAMMHPSKELLEQGARPMTSAEVDEYTGNLSQIEYERNVHFEGASLVQSWKFSGEKKKIFNSYKDITGVGWDLSDGTWDAITREVIINAPLIVASGGAASIARAGLTKGACALAERIVIRQAIKEGARVSARSLAEKGAERMAQWALKGTLLQRNIVGAERIGALVGEAAAFEIAHSGLTGNWAGNLPEWGQRIFWTSLTLGTLHYSGRKAEKLFRTGGKEVLLGKYTSKLPAGPVRSATEFLIAKGHIEAASFMLIGAIQNGVMTGDISEFMENFGEELFHSYVTVDALKLSGLTKVIVPGSKGKTFEVQMKRTGEKPVDSKVNERGRNQAPAEIKVTGQKNEVQKENEQFSTQFSTIVETLRTANTETSVATLQGCLAFFKQHQGEIRKALQDNFTSTMSDLYYSLNDPSMADSRNSTREQLCHEMRDLFLQIMAGNSDILEQKYLDRHTLLEERTLANNTLGNMLKNGIGEVATDIVLRNPRQASAQLLTEIIRFSDRPEAAREAEKILIEGIKSGTYDARSLKLLLRADDDILLSESDYESGQRIIDAVLKSYGLDPIQCKKAWDIGYAIDSTKYKTREAYFDSLHENRINGYLTELDIRTRLERMEPGAVAMLESDMFGMRMFGRYVEESNLGFLKDDATLKFLVDQVRNKENTEIPYTLIITARTDRNGALRHLNNFHENFQWTKQFSGKRNLRFIEVGSVGELARRLILLENKYGKEQKPAEIIINGHGTEMLIWLAANKGFSTSTLGRERIQQNAKKFFGEHPTIILNSCSTGKNEGIAQQLSLLLDAKVIAPDRPAWISSMSATAGDRQIDFAIEHGSRENYGNVQTMYYDGGGLVQAVENVTMGLQLAAETGIMGEAKNTPNWKVGDNAKFLDPITLKNGTILSTNTPYQITKIDGNYCILLCHNEFVKIQMSKLLPKTESSAPRANLNPPPLPKRSPRDTHEQRKVGEEAKIEKVQLSNEEIEIMRYADEYANFSQSQKDMPAEFVGKLRELQKRGLFLFQCYNDFRVDTGYPKSATRNPQYVNDLGYIINDGAPKMNQSDNRDYFKNKSEKDAVEALILRPIYHLNTVVGRETKIVEEPGWLWGTKKVKRDFVRLGDVPFPYSKAVPNCTSSEQLVRITYEVSDSNVYRTNVVEDIPGGKVSLQEQDKSGMRVPVGSYKNQQHDIANARKIAEKTPSHIGRPGNQVAASVVLPESEARILYQLFQNHPEMIRPFFIAGTIKMQTFHNPPPYKKWDKVQRPILLREFSGPREYNDTFVTVPR